MINKLYHLICLTLLIITLPVLAQTYTEEETPFEERKKHIVSKCGDAAKPIRVVGFVTNPPLGWTDTIYANRRENNGFGLKVFEKIAAEENLHIENTGYTSYQEALATVKSDRADVVLGMYYDPQLLDGIELIYPSYTGNPFIVLFKKGNERPVQKFDDLVGLKGVTRREELVYPLIFNSLDVKLDMTQVSGARAAFEGLLNGTYDYMFTSLYNAETELRRFKLIDDIVMTDVPLTQPEVFFAMGRNSDCAFLKDTISKKIREFKSNPSAMQKMLIDEINAWGKRFEKDPSLPEILATEKAAAEQPAGEQSTEQPDDATQSPESDTLDTPQSDTQPEPAQNQPRKPKITVIPNQNANLTVPTVQSNNAGQTPNT